MENEYKDILRRKMLALSAENDEEKKIKVDIGTQMEKERLRNVPIQMLDGTWSTVYAEAKKFWLSPIGLETINRAKNRGFE